MSGMSATIVSTSKTYSTRHFYCPSPDVNTEKVWFFTIKKSNLNFHRSYLPNDSICDSFRPCIDIANAYSVLYHKIAVTTSSVWARQAFQTMRVSSKVDAIYIFFFPHILTRKFTGFHHFSWKATRLPHFFFIRILGSMYPCHKYMLNSLKIETMCMWTGQNQIRLRLLSHFSCFLVIQEYGKTYHFTIWFTSKSKPVPPYFYFRNVIITHKATIYQIIRKPK